MLSAEWRQGTGGCVNTDTQACAGLTLRPTPALEVAGFRAGLKHVQLPAMAATISNANSQRAGHEIYAREGLLQFLVAPVMETSVLPASSRFCSLDFNYAGCVWLGGGGESPPVH